MRPAEAAAQKTPSFTGMITSFTVEIAVVASFALLDVKLLVLPALDCVLSLLAPLVPPLLHRFQ
ncbi:MAG: hypothetical protein ACFFB3_14145 [Candidatus Hodarchaeota archaeon]